MKSGCIASYFGQKLFSLSFRLTTRSPSADANYTQKWQELVETASLQGLSIQMFARYSKVSFEAISGMQIRFQVMSVKQSLNNEFWIGILNMYTYFSVSVKPYINRNMFSRP